MIYLLLSIFASTVILIVFKGFAQFNVNRLQAIVVNYIVAACCGFFFYSGSVTMVEIPKLDWFVPAMALGFLFIAIFNLMALTAQKAGLAVVSVATKMSVAIPIAFGLLYYKESAHFYKLIGIILAFVAVYLTAAQKKQANKKNAYSLWLPIGVFLGSGIIDTSIKYLEDSYVAQDQVSVFSASIFAAAALIGMVLLTVQHLKGKLRLARKNILGGIILGIPNYFSIYFLVLALRTPNLDSSSIFTLNNIAIVVLSTLVGLLFFKEQLSTKNWIGVLLAIGSIVLITLSK